MTRAAVMIFLALLTTVTAWAQSFLPAPDGDNNVTITAAGTYNATGTFNNIIIADGVQDVVTLNVGNLTISGTIQNENSPIIWNVSEGSSLTFTGNEPIHVDEFNMSGGQVHVNNMEIMGECTISGGTINGTGDMSAQSLTIGRGTISGGSFNTTTFAVAHATISGATINTGTFQVNDEVTINAANPSLSITAQNFYFYNGSITITNGGLTDGTNEYSGTITAISTSGVTTLTPINKVTVTLDAQGGSGGTTSVEATPNIAMPSITPPSWTGHIFGGYFTETNGGGTKYYNADGSSAKDCDLNTATTLYAQWTASTTCTVTLDHQNGTATTSVTATNGVSMPSVTPPTRTGYTFGGYFTETNGGGTQYYYADGTSAKNCDFTQATTLYAKWTAHTYRINFYGNGSTSGGMVSQYFTYDAESQALSANQYVRAFTVTYNYNGATGGNSDASTTATATFNGWATSADGEKVYDDGQSVSNLTSGYSIALYAKWTDASITLPTPTKTGYAFGGWYSDAECNTLVGDAGSSYTPGSDVTLYARWKKLLSHSDITVEIPAQTYNGSELTPVITVKDNGSVVSDEHYDINLAVDRTNAGDHPITITAKGMVYAGEISPTFTINQVSLTVTAKPNTITYGDKPANDGVTYSGFINSEGESVLSGSLEYVYKTAADGTGDDFTASSPIGTYYIIPGGLTSSNYDITFASGTLTVNPKAVTITADDKTKEYGEADPTLTATVEGLVGSDAVTYTVSREAGEAVGTYAITPTGDAEQGNYAVTYVARTFTITPKPVTVKNSSDQDVPAATGDATITEDENGITLTLITPTGTDAPQTVSIPQEIQVDHVEVERTYSGGKASTVYLPFSIGIDKVTGGKFHKFTGVDETKTPWEVNYDEVTASVDGGIILANTPYIFLPDGTGDTKMTVNNGSDKITVGTGIASTPQKDAGETWEFIGTYEPIQWLSDNSRADEIGLVYGFAAKEKTGYTVGQFVKIASGAYIKPMRAYLKRAAAAGARAMTRGRAESLPSAMTVVLRGANGGTTEIGTFSLDRETGEWYSLDGRKLSGKPARKGLYIKDGRKTVIK